MANDDSKAQAHQQPPSRVPTSRDWAGWWARGRYQVAQKGRVRFEWMEGGFFLLQHVDLEQYGQKVKGIEVIGHERPFGDVPGEEIKSRFYDNMGNTLDYVYELERETLTIWGGEKWSPTYSKSTFGDTLSGEWVYPEGGGYLSTITRVD